MKEAYRVLQMALADLGHDPGPIDGLMGAMTKKAMRSYTASKGDKAATLEPPRFKGEGKRIEDIDLPRIGHKIGVGEDEIHAVIDVESAGSGFDDEGRVRMLFEPHIFWRELGPGAARDRAAAKGLARPSWRRDYPDDSYPRLHDAMEIDQDAALRSCSWGLGQIMGFNCKLAGYETAWEMVDHFADDEDRHLEAMVQFIVSANLDDELREHDWAAFARGYNGPDYRENGYHVKLRQRFEWWQGKRDTPFNLQAGVA